MIRKRSFNRLLFSFGVILFGSVLYGIFLLTYEANRYCTAKESYADYLSNSLVTEMHIMEDSKNINSAVEGVLKPVNSPLNVYIVEEHHEVIPFWFNAANQGVISKRGNTLIHIDGHNDMAAPQFYPEFPFFRWPKSTEEMNNYMQQNDMFIIAAAMSGLISKVVWVWPTWDSKEDHPDPFQHTLVNIGWMVVNSSDVTLNDNLEKKTFCICTIGVLNKTSGEECNRLPLSQEEETYENKEGVKIESRECIIETSIIYEEIREDIALEKLKQMANIFANDKVILDIDEDFYGCTYASQPLLNAGYLETSISEMNFIVSALFCPENAQEELETDSELNKFIKEIKKSNCYIKNIENKKPNQCDGLKVLKDNYSIHFRTTVKHLVCNELLKDNLMDLEILVEAFVDKINEMNESVINALLDVGFCFTSTPVKGFIKTLDSSFQICHGANFPNGSMVVEHQTNLTEITERSKLVKNILGFLRKKLNPSLVTVCRSSRDGYTPREHQSKIESDLLRILRTEFSIVKVNYDEELLGGRNGWGNRRY